MEEKETNYYEIVFKLKQMYYDAKEARSIKEINLLIAEAKIYIFYVDILKKEFIRKVENAQKLLSEKRNLSEYDKNFLTIAKFIWGASYDVELDISEEEELVILKDVLCKVLFVLFFHVENIAMNEYFKCFMDNPNKKEIKLPKRQMEVIEILRKEPYLPNDEIAKKMGIESMKDHYRGICEKVEKTCKDVTIDSYGKRQVVKLMQEYRFTPKK